MRGILPLLLIGLGFYILRDYIFKPKADDIRFSGPQNAAGTTSFALSQPNLGPNAEYDREADFGSRSRFGSWRDR